MSYASRDARAQMGKVGWHQQDRLQTRCGAAIWLRCSHLVSESKGSSLVQLLTLLLALTLAGESSLYHLHGRLDKVPGSWLHSSSIWEANQ